jgi:hypothetical protein
MTAGRAAQCPLSGVKPTSKLMLATNLVIATLSGERLRVEKSLANTERMGVQATENEWDFGR